VAGLQPPIHVRYTPVGTKRQFFQTLQAIAEEARLYSRIPILHIEAHGCDKGIEVTSGEFIEWAELKDALAEINAITGLNLLVLMSACGGAHLLSIIQPADRAPVYAMIGPHRVVKAWEIETGSLAFYRTLFEKADGIAAWQAMNDAINPHSRTFSLFPAEYWFREAYRRFQKELCSEQALSQRENSFLPPTDVPREIVEQRRQLFRAYIRDFPARFAEFKSHFFFCDLYPDNVTRFTISFEDCTKAP